MFKNIIGHKKITAFLEKSVRGGNLPHAYLFYGPEGLGKRTVALEMAGSLLGKEVAGNPDFLLVEPLPDKREIIIDQIRSLTHNLNLTAYSGNWKIVLINDAHLMNEAAASALLKVLEEPKGKTLLFVISHCLDRILPTIVSRCQPLKFGNVSFEEIKKSTGADDDLIRISRGCPGAVISRLQDGGWREDFQKSKKDFDFLMGAYWPERYKWVAGISDDVPVVKNTLDSWTFYLRESLVGIPANAGRKAARLKAIMAARRFLDNSEFNVKLILENLLLEIV